MPPTIRLQGRFWRVLAPRWAHQPLSGQGAARRGGRWNEPGQPALYMSESFVTAVAQYEQELGIRPGTLCAYKIDVAAIVDLCDPSTRAVLGLEDSVLFSPWKHIAFVQQARPPSWELAVQLAAEDAAGIRVPSVREPTGTNLVLWRWNDGPSCRVEALDPLGDLPRDQSSWSA
jgi:RES domain-containing protein